MDRRLLQNIGLAILSTLLCLLGLEILARLTYTQPWYEQLVLHQGRNEASSYTKNRFGLRGPDFVQPKPPGHHRILVLGDSFTYGFGVADDAAVFPARLEERLRAEVDLPGVEHFEVLNGGIPGSLTDEWLELWDQVGDAFDPDTVMIVFFLRDGTQTGSIPGFFGVIREQIVERNAQSFPYRVSYGYRWVRDRLDRVAVAERYTRGFHEAYFGDAEQTVEWQNAQRNLLELRDRIQARGAQVAFVVFPILVDLGDDYPFEEICQLLEDFGNTHGMPTHNLLPAFRGRRGSDFWVSALDQHPNAEGHRVAAESLFPFLEELLASSPGAGLD